MNPIKGVRGINRNFTASLGPSSKLNFFRQAVSQSVREMFSWCSMEVNPIAPFLVIDLRSHPICQPPLAVPKKRTGVLYEKANWLSDCHHSDFSSSLPGGLYRKLRLAGWT
jgi:hypothetical protein